MSVEALMLACLAVPLTGAVFIALLGNAPNLRRNSNFMHCRAIVSVCIAFSSDCCIGISA